MQPRIENIEPKKLVGKSLTMSLTDNKTGLLWSSFIPRLSDISHKTSYDKLSLQVYDTNYFDDCNPDKAFVKWALIEVSDFDNVPKDLETFELSGGLYAVFIHKGDSKEFYKTAQYIYGVWLPYSEYVLDDRPHFEVLGTKTKKDDPDSEEEVWIPIKPKTDKQQADQVKT
jgi:AraC family transcriptional regulator